VSDEPRHRDLLLGTGVVDLLFGFEIVVLLTASGFAGRSFGVGVGIGVFVALAVVGGRIHFGWLERRMEAAAERVYGESPWDPIASRARRRTRRHWRLAIWILACLCPLIALLVQAWM
jgi:hypothetical protein